MISEPTTVSGQRGLQIGFNYFSQYSAFRGGMVNVVGTGGAGSAGARVTAYALSMHRQDRHTIRPFSAGTSASRRRTVNLDSKTAPPIKL